MFNSRNSIPIPNACEVIELLGMVRVMCLGKTAWKIYTGGTILIFGSMGVVKDKRDCDILSLKGYADVYKNCK